MAITINGTTGIAGVDGSAATPAVQGADTNTGVFYPAADTVGVSTGGTERMRIDSSGNVGIGGTPASGHKLNIIGTAATTFGAWGVTGTTTAGSYAQFVNTGNTTIIGVESSAGASLCGGTSAYATIFGTSSAASVQFVTNNSTRTTIDSSGNLLVGTTSTAPRDFASGGGIALQPAAASEFASASSSVSFINYTGSSAGSGTFITFRQQGAARGSISTNGSVTAYNTSSDYRLKNTIAPMTGALAKVSQLKPVTYKWNANNSESEGFIAHELAEVVPQCVTGEKDEIDADGNPVYQGIDVSFLVATLTAAIQEQQALITQLQADVAALKGTP